MVRVSLYEKIRRLMSDFGYEYRDGRLIQKAIAYMPERVLPYRFKSEVAALDHLIPIIADNEFSNAARRIMRAS